MSEYPDLDSIFHLQWPPQASSHPYSQVPGTVSSLDRSELSSPPASHLNIVQRGPNHNAGPSHQNVALRQQELSFVEEQDWDPHKKYAADCFHYSLEWKARLNRKAFTTQSEPIVVVSLDCYWRRVLKDRLEEVLSVTQRALRPVTTDFDVDKLDWTVPDGQLLEWSQHFRNGKSLRVNLSFNYVEGNPESASRATRRADRRGQTSASTRMRADRVRHIETERQTTGLDSNWPEAYAFVRCQKQSCESGPHCLVDSNDVHRKIYPTHLKRFVEHVAEHGLPATHNGIPSYLQHQIIAEDEERRKHKEKKKSVSGPAVPPISITNVMPGPSGRTPQAESGQVRSTPGHHVHTAGLTQLEFLGLREDALRKYTMWQQSRFRDPVIQAEFGKALEIALKKRLFLEFDLRKSGSSYLCGGRVCPRA
ncbi:hypothetical protein LTR96_011243 [Exophiala xenobiotica]|nr:hypothetical protein LTR92_010936 [Exophiala xenobiotica]KAK5263350.1 hypothetical protein LTR96_011243 [Exophiala xenobiotica]KAK5332766.1 hypothetical protein LTR98_011103 [Exophiala xenobiotica]KAK5400018.1 hypothetical protein LTR06_011327 [Exophiala xenobiotica]